MTLRPHFATHFLRTVDYLTSRKHVALNTNRNDYSVPKNVEESREIRWKLTIFEMILQTIKSHFISPISQYEGEVKCLSTYRLQESLANAKVNARQHCVVWSHSNAGNAIWRTTMFHVVAPQTRNHAKFRENSTLQQFKVIQGHRSWYQLKAHM